MVKTEQKAQWTQRDVSVPMGKKQKWSAPHVSWFSSGFVLASQDIGIRNKIIEKDRKKIKAHIVSFISFANVFKIRKVVRKLCIYLKVQFLFSLRCLFNPTVLLRHRRIRATTDDNGKSQPNGLSSFTLSHPKASSIQRWNHLFLLLHYHHHNVSFR